MKKFFWNNCIYYTVFIHKIKKNRSPNFDLSVANRIENLLTEHLSICKDLIVALKNNNQRLANELNDKWYKKADEMANFFSSINPYYSREKLRDMLYDHLELTSDEVDARLKKDYKADINAFDKVPQEV